MKKILVLGCTGSIGSQTIDIVRMMKNDFCIVGLSAGHNKKMLETLCKEFDCQGTLFIEEGIQGIQKLIASCGADIAVNGIAGAAGLEPSVLVLQAGMDLALANKETVVMAWPVVKKIAQEHKANIIPVDSEHSAIFSLINQAGKQNIQEVIITASGGPFKDFTEEQLKNVTVEQALHHPTWNMGKKITIDSSTLANKGLEVIEACRLFDISPEKVQVVVHPQSLIHSLVRTHNGMLYAQISNPDMRHPIFDALTWPDIKANYLTPFNLAGNTMTFFPPRLDAFPLLQYAYDCAKKSNSYTIAFNAANEIAVQAFLEKKCSYTQISHIVNEVLQEDWSENPDSIEKIYSADKKARNKAISVLVSNNGGYG
ncbi:MAG: 1-deoxy-D-xylulose-5-phosphate reductoisomerase, partial [Treponema sp.]|nr:1-deoxy-D-xylulose-5-phosphate reductoisomerase [Treponema sp.]